MSEHGEELVLAPIRILQVVQQARILQRDRRLCSDAGEEPLVLGREVSFRAVDESEPAEELAGAQGDGRGDEAADAGALEFAALRRLDPDGTAAPAEPRQLVQLQIRELVAAPAGRREQAQ